MNEIQKELDRLRIEEKLKSILFIEDVQEESIQWGMNYITFSLSKRIRPLMLLESNLIYSSLDNDAYILASAVELIHTYSLVHDDLPSMDNDDLRRGIKTLHKVKNEAYAILVGDALLTRGFGILSKYSKKELLPEIITIFSDKSGYQGMIKGQGLDMISEGKTLNIDEINLINMYKTGRLFELSLLAGAINGGAGQNDLENIEKLGTVLGQIFQIKDDILDITGDNEVLGKNAGSDQKNEKSSIPLVIGIEESEKLLMKNKDLAFSCINKLPDNRDFFYKLIDFIIERKR